MCESSALTPTYHIAAHCPDSGEVRRAQANLLGNVVTQSIGQIVIVEGGQGIAFVQIQMMHEVAIVRVDQNFVLGEIVQSVAMHEGNLQRWHDASLDIPRVLCISYSGRWYRSMVPRTENVREIIEEHQNGRYRRCSSEIRMCPSR